MCYVIWQVFYVQISTSVWRIHTTAIIMLHVSILMEDTTAHVTLDTPWMGQTAPVSILN